ncbi:two-component regulator propeller domain-containing protein [Pelomonas sp. SE-A7]|uniref:two-component regulator propeller domain-containing protein n=1 Tax=Pelomonas sp. SE-A7 TaxID=3054953 RepID=UPI00259C6FAE|nr:two-component regulator propeller domain-containing protein [Pelomonas sp. SE-A7]MDM4766025.1 two-component regulator propeller domain-containing protein [Pelomonas sp. SE-A7]
MQSLRFELLGNERLDSAGVLICALQDDLGQMWLGTTGGLVRYDGRRGWRFPHNPRDPGSLSHSWVQSLLWQDDGRLLVATVDGLNLFDPRSETNERLAWPEERRLPERSVRQLQPAGPGRVWVQTPWQLLQYEMATRRFTAVPLEGLNAWPRVGKPRLEAMQSDGKGGVWLVAGADLTHLDATGRVLQRWPLAAPPTGQAWVSSMVLDKRGRAWLGGPGWLRVLDLGDGRELDLPQRLGLPQRTIHALGLDDEGSIWIGTGGAGAWRVKPGGESAEAFRNHPAIATSLNNDTVSAFFQDRSGVLWIGTWVSQISLVDLRQGGMRHYARVFSEADTLPSNFVFGMDLDDDRHLWLGTYGKGVVRLDLETGTAEQPDAGDLQVGYVQTLKNEPGRGLWIGADTGLYWLPEGTRKIRPAALGEATSKLKPIVSLVLDPAGRLWIGASHGIHVRERDGQVRVLPSQVEGAKATLSESELMSMLVDAQGRLWVGTNRGLRLLQGERFIQPLLRDEGGLDLETLVVTSLKQDRGGRLWMASSAGLFSLEPAGERWKLRPWSDLPGQPPGRVSYMQLGHDDALWFVSTGGIVRMDPERREVQRFGGTALRFLPGHSGRASALGADGRIYFGQPGVLEIDLPAFRRNSAAPSVLLSDLQVYNRSLREADPGAAPDEADPSARVLADVGVQGVLERATKLRLSHREAMVSFDLRAQHFYGNAQLRYAWKLDGFDKRWIEGRPGQGLATYTNLDAGHYRLLAKAANPDGVWSEPRELIAVEVLPPWWRAPWFRALLAVSLVASVALAWQLRLRRLKRIQRELEAEVANRTRQIATLSEIGRELTASLDLAAIRRALFEHVESLMPATVFGVGLVNREERVVEFDFMVERGKAFKPYRRSLDAPEQPAARCVATGEAFILREFGHDNRDVDAGVRAHEGQRLQLVDGSEPAQSRSALYVPLKIKGEVIGILSVLSEQPDAYTQTHLDMLQTLGAYTAVALDNADAYRALQAAQSQLVEQRKLASLGHLVAGVAHELNTPLGNGLLAATTLCEDANRLVDGLAQGQLRRSELEGFRESLALGGELLLRSLETASRLVASFKQLAVDQASEQRRRFDLAGLAEEFKQARVSGLSEFGHSLELVVPPGLVLDSFPGGLRQVLEQLLDNAVEHGLAGRRGGHLRLSAEPLGAERIRLRFSDDGQGMAPDVIGRVFDPFFTTRFGRGSNGLGLHLAYTLVHSMLGGQISVSSEPGQGSVFEIQMPREAPRRD